MADRPVEVACFYRTKWGHHDEFVELFTHNHLPVLHEQVKRGRLLGVRVQVPRFHGDGRADWTALERVHASTRGCRCHQSASQECGRSPHGPPGRAHRREDRCDAGAEDDRPVRRMATNIRLSDAEVRRIRDQRRQGEFDIRAILQAEIERDPASGEGRRNGHLFVVAEPVLAHPEMLMPVVGRQPARVAPQHVSKRCAAPHPRMGPGHLLGDSGRWRGSTLLMA